MDENVKEKPSFFRSHVDTLAIIGVNVAIAAILISMCISNSNRIDALNTRIDAANSRTDTLIVMFYDLLKEVKNK